MQEYERAVIFRLGRVLPGGAKGPGKYLPYLLRTDLCMFTPYPNQYHWNLLLGLQSELQESKLPVCGFFKGIYDVHIIFWYYCLTGSHSSVNTSILFHMESTSYNQHGSVNCLTFNILLSQQ